MKNIYVEYIDTITGNHNTEVLNWLAFCDLSMEPQMKIIFCCSTDDPRVNKELAARLIFLFRFPFGFIFETIPKMNNYSKRRPGRRRAHSAPRRPVFSRTDAVQL